MQREALPNATPGHIASPLPFPVRLRACGIEPALKPGGAIELTAEGTQLRIFETGNASFLAGCAFCLRFLPTVKAAPGNAGGRFLKSYAV